MDFWGAQRVVVTGGSGFLGRRLVDRLRALGCASLDAPTHADCDLRNFHDVIRMYERLRPTLVLHAAGVVGGIGAKRRRPAEFFYDNLLMGLQLLGQAHRTGVARFVAMGTVCAYPKDAPVPFRADDRSKRNGQMRRRLDTSRARELSGFTANTPFDEGLKQTVEQYLASSGLRV